MPYVADRKFSFFGDRYNEGDVVPEGGGITQEKLDALVENGRIKWSEGVKKYQGIPGIRIDPDSKKAFLDPNANVDQTERRSATTGGAAPNSNVEPPDIPGHDTEAPSDSGDAGD